MGPHPHYYRALPVKCLRYCATIALLAIVLTSMPARGFTLSLPPALTWESAQTASASLIELLERITGEDFELAKSLNPHTYLNDIRSGDLAVLVTENHLLGRLQQLGLFSAAWFIDYLTSFVVVVSSDNNSVYQLSDLAGSKMCAEAVPALFTLHLLYSVANPNREPVIDPVVQDKRKIRYLLSGRCNAAILDLNSYRKLAPTQEIERLKIVFQSRTIPVYGIGISQRLPVPVRNRLMEILGSPEGKSALAPINRLLVGEKALLKQPDHRRLNSLSAIVEDWLE